jgi:replication factor C large subunit
VENIVTKDSRSDIFNAITGVLKSKTPAHVKEAMWIEEDPTLVMEYIAENIPREYKKTDEIKKAYDYISKADIFFGRTQRSRNYGYWKYASDFMGIGVSNSKHETYKKFTKIQTPSIFGLMGRNRGKRNLRDKICERMFEKMHVSSGVAVSMFPYLEIMFQNDELAWEISDFLGFFDEDDEKETEKLIKVFRKKKIPKKVITKMEKQKAQMRVEERDRRAEELKNQMINVIEEVEEPQENALPFEIPGIDTTSEEISKPEETVEEKIPENPVKETEETVEEKIPENPVKETEETVEEKIPEKTEKKEKKKTDKQVSLFSF